MNNVFVLLLTLLAATAGLCTVPFHFSTQGGALKDTPL
jgi:hypothetical protein